MAGSFDNEAVAIFALLTTFYLWVRAVNLGTVASATLAAFAYLYMAASWGAYGEARSDPWVIRGDADRGSDRGLRVTVGAARSGGAAQRSAELG